MKKFLTAILAIVMIISFTACSDGSDTPDTSDFETSEETSRETTVQSADTTAQTSVETSEETTAQTESLAPAKVKVAIFTDPHSALIDTTAGTRRPSLSPGKIKRMMDKFEKMGVEYVLCLGDFIENSGDKAENTEMLEMMMDIIRSYDIPFYTLLGNHDCDAFTKEEFYEIAGIEATPQSLRIGDALFVYLDANFLADGMSYEPGNIDWKSTLIPQDQLDSYKAAWQSTDASEVYVFMHQNADTNIPDERYWISNAEQVQDALAECPKLKGVFQGHYHKGYNSLIDGIPYRTIPAVCEGEEMPYIIIDV